MWQRRIVDVLRGVRTHGETPLKALLKHLYCECCTKPMDLPSARKNHRSEYEATVAIQATTSVWILDAHYSVNVTIHGSAESFPVTVFSTICKWTLVAPTSGSHACTCITCFALLHPPRRGQENRRSAALSQLLYRRGKQTAATVLGAKGKTIATASMFRTGQCIP